jgi:hypothetical protein
LIGIVSWSCLTGELLVCWWFCNFLCCLYREVVTYRNHFSVVCLSVQNTWVTRKIIGIGTFSLILFIFFNCVSSFKPCVTKNEWNDQRKSHVSTSVLFVRTTQKLLVQFHLNFTRKISYKSSCASCQHFWVQLYLSKKWPFNDFDF